MTGKVRRTGTHRLSFFRESRKDLEMEKFKNWWKQDKRYLTMTKAVLFALLPLVCCLVYCAVQGKSIGEVYLPGSEWNDELFYYKHRGIPFAI